MTKRPIGIVHAGMYAGHAQHRLAWQAWFKAFSARFLYHGFSALELGFGHKDADYLSSGLVASQSCGYPLVKRWSKTHRPVAVACFDLPGCTQEGRYSSWFVTHADNPRKALSEFTNQRLAINSPDSNSGMNVLRYAISQLPVSRRQSPFFSAVKISGGHLSSMQMIAAEKADLAAIDVISYALALRSKPALASQLKLVGQSIQTMGLPFMVPNSCDIDTNQLAEAMHLATQEMDKAARESISLSGFVAVKFADYASIAALETRAQEANYPQLI